MTNYHKNLHKSIISIYLEVIDNIDVFSILGKILASRVHLILGYLRVSCGILVRSNRCNRSLTILVLTPAADYLHMNLDPSALPLGGLFWTPRLRGTLVVRESEMPSYIQRREGKKGVSWRVRFPLVDEDGQPGFHTKTFPRRTDAKEYLEELRAAEKSGAAVVESEQTLSEFFDEYLEAVDVKERTSTSYKQLFNLYIKPRLGSVPLKNVTPRRIQNLYNFLKKPLSPRTVRLVHSVLHSALDHGVALKLIRTNPSEGLKLPSKQRSEISYLQGKEIKELLEQIKPSPYAPLFEFMLATGVRPGEARAVMWSDIDRKKKTVLIQRTASDSKPWTFEETKTAKSKRTISLPQQTVDMLKELQTQQTEYAKQRAEEGDPWADLGLVFTTPAGEPLERRNLNRKHLKPALLRVAGDKKLKLTEEDQERVTSCNLYSLRHTHATSLIEAGVNVRTVSDRLGHKEVKTTLETYAHHTPAMEEQATKEITSALYG